MTNASSKAFKGQVFWLYSKNIKGDPLTLLTVLSTLSLALFASLAILAFRWMSHYRELVQLREQIRQKDQDLALEAGKLEVIKEELEKSFAHAANEALKGSNQEFLKMAELTLSQHQQKANHQLENKRNEISQVVDPLKETLGQFYKEVTTMEKERQRSYALVENEIKKMVEVSTSLSSETRALTNALKKPNVRGRWGEIQLKNCVELAGMSEFSDFTMQKANDINGKVLIPDMVVKMPTGRIVVVDAKTPLDAFLESLETSDESKRREYMVNHGKQVREHVVKLSRKSYGEQFEQSADFTIMFLPNESFLYAALETQADLVEFALDKQILIATPPTFVGLLKVVRHGWNEERLNKNAQEISKIGIELHKRVGDFMDAYLDIGISLDKAHEQYELGLKRLNSRVIPQAKKMEKLGAKSHKELSLSQ